MVYNHMNTNTLFFTIISIQAAPLAAPAKAPDSNPLSFITDLLSSLYGGQKTAEAYSGNEDKDKKKASAQKYKNPKNNPFLRVGDATAKTSEKSGGSLVSAQSNEKSSKMNMDSHSH